MKSITVLAAGVLLLIDPLAAQVSPTTPKAPQIKLIKGPEIELSKDFLTIIRWTTNNPGGSPEHFAVVHYGTDPKHLDQTATSPLRLNPEHPKTVFRVRMNSLKARTTYYYSIGSTEANGREDKMKSGVYNFKTP